MNRGASGQPTELELRILKVLWAESPLPVREIRNRLAENGRHLAHTSVITTLNTMFEKKFLGRKKQANAFLFFPKVTRDAVSQRMLGDVVERVFDGSAASVMLSLFDCSEIDAEEARELRRLFNRKIKEQQE
jgi:BlaI family transcriptional regulator, penicillinase repressor